MRQRNGDGMKQYLLGVLHRRSFSSLAADDVLKPSGLVDSFGRKHTYLRISLTEKCNLRCVYCMPEHGVKLTAKERLMTLEERKRAISLFVDQGINKLRFTGGEPTVSNQLSELISFARERISFVAITSNGIMLRDQLRGLLDAGLTSVNISLDTLEEKKFAAITRRDGKLLRKVMASIYGAVAAGLPVKVNIVIMRGTNDDEMHRFVALTKDMPIDVRFIELMPFDGNEWSPTSFVGYLEIIDRLRMEQVPFPLLYALCDVADGCCRVWSCRGTARRTCTTRPSGTALPAPRGGLALSLPCPGTDVCCTVSVLVQI